MKVTIEFLLGGKELLPRALCPASSPNDVLLALGNLRRQPMIGTIRTINPRGFAFLDVPDHKEVFLHATAVRDRMFEDLRVGQRVSFDITHEARGFRAFNVKVLD
jgi:CspA family cold shock protein